MFVLYQTFLLLVVEQLVLQLFVFLLLFLPLVLVLLQLLLIVFHLEHHQLKFQHNFLLFLLFAVR
jgi:hypothetical protein